MQAHIFQPAKIRLIFHIRKRARYFFTIIFIFLRILGKKTIFYFPFSIPFRTFAENL